MTAERIDQLTEFVAYPTDHLTAFKVTKSDLCNPTHAGRIPFALNAPDFGWQFALIHHETTTQLPPDITEMSLRRAYWHLTGEYTDQTIQHVLAFEHPAYFCQRNLLRAYLMCEELSLEQIAQKMDQSVEVVKTYGELFFNVRDRMDDKIYLATVAFPDTWIKQACSQSITELPADRLLLQLGLHYGVGYVDYFAGVSAKSPGPDTLEGQVQEFTNNIMNHAYLMAQAGGLSQSNVPAIDMAVQLINARRKGQSRRSAHEIAAVDGPSAGESILQTMMGVAGIG